MLLRSSRSIYGASPLARMVLARSMASEKKSTSALDLFEELESYEQQQQQKTSEAPVRRARRGDDGVGPLSVTRVTAREPKIRGSPRRLNIIAGLLVGKTYPELRNILPTVHNTGSKSALRAIENAKKAAFAQFNVQDEGRLVVEQAWVGKGEMQPRLKIHARGKTGIMHRRWGKMWVQMRYISPEDDEVRLQKTSLALEAAGIPKHRVRHLLRFGPRSTVFRISKAAGLTRQQGRSYLRMLSVTNDDYRKLKFGKRAGQASGGAGGAAAASAAAEAAEDVIGATRLKN